ncbi:MAG: protein kinase [Verrucomicrobiae bacterium]|nr:protein kinase [Verrucomicrobiae bacterium]
MSTASSKPCEKCGQPIAAGKLMEGLCPACLIGGALQQSAMQVECPHCRQTNEITDETASRVSCRNCGESFRLDLAEAVQILDRPLKKWGRFELQRILGAGAFGTVWEALDPSLHRRVAIKIPRKGHFDKVEDEERFLREAQIAAQLRHPGIVPVYETSKFDGQPFIVSEFVEGITLARWLKEHRPDFRQTAAWMASIADILAHAHAQQVIHRDLKPSNILLENKPSGGGLHPRLMDFGMAKRDGSDPTLTLDGHMLGTPVYMSPEQIRSSHLVDARADIYSMGVVLYELLTGELPFQGVPHMVIHQILHDDARSPRELNDRIPIDLATIALKCLEKDPCNRYPSAAELGEDLRRWLAGDPILARPAGPLGKTVRWLRRNPLISLLAALLALAVAGGFTAVLWQWQRAETGLREAEAQRQKAEKNFREARDTVDAFYSKVEQRLRNVPGLQPLRRELLEKALHYHRNFIREKPTDPEMRRALAVSLRRTGDIMREMGNRREALPFYQQAQKILDDILKQNPKRVETRANVAQTQIQMGDLLEELGQPAKAIDCYRQAETILQDISKNGNNPRWLTALGGCHTATGLAQGEMGRQDEALVHFKQAIQLHEQVLAIQPQDPETQYLLGCAENNQGLTLWQMGRFAEAADSHQSAIRRFQSAGADETHAIESAIELAIAHYNLGSARLAQQRTTEAAAEFETARQLLVKQAATNPSLFRCREYLAKTLGQLGNMELAKQHPGKALGCYRESCRLREALANQLPTVPIWKDLALIQMNQGVAASVVNPVEAIPYYKKAETTLSMILKDYPSHFESIELLGLLNLNHSEALWQIGQKEESIRYLKKCIGQKTVLSLQKPNDRKLINDLEQMKQLLARRTGSPHSRK